MIAVPAYPCLTAHFMIGFNGSCIRSAAGMPSDVKAGVIGTGAVTNEDMSRGRLPRRFGLNRWLAVLI
jgi:hypothetical protein